MLLAVIPEAFVHVCVRARHAFAHQDSWAVCSFATEQLAAAAIQRLNAQGARWSNRSVILARLVFIILEIHPP